MIGNDCVWLRCAFLLACLIFLASMLPNSDPFVLKNNPGLSRSLSRVNRSQFHQRLQISLLLRFCVAILKVILMNPFISKKTEVESPTRSNNPQTLPLGSFPFYNVFLSEKVNNWSSSGDVVKLPP